MRGGLLIALRADMFAAEEVRDVVDIVPGKAMALDVVTAGGTLTVINVHGPGSGGDSWASKASFWADVAMYSAAKSAGGTRAVLLGGDFNVWLESPWHPTTRRFQALWEQCLFRRARSRPYLAALVKFLKVSQNCGFPHAMLPLFACLVTFCEVDPIVHQMVARSQQKKNKIWRK